jgi:hypothetical protein
MALSRPRLYLRFPWSSRIRRSVAEVADRRCDIRCAYAFVFDLAILMGYQSVLFAIFAKTFAIREGLLPKDPRVDRFFNVIYLESGLAIGAAAFLSGLILLGVAVLQWKSVHFGRLDYTVTMRWVIPGATLTALGFQTVLSSFFVSILGMKRRPIARDQQT